MRYTISDFYQTYHNEIKLISGKEGLYKEINDVGILDYEMDPLLKDKYFHLNFHENLLVISTFSVLKDNPFKLSDTIKHLIDTGCSGLVIKNIFRIPIPESVLRYADYKGFPIFLIEKTDLFLENIIYEVFHRAETIKNISFIQNEIDLLLYQNLSGSEIKDHVKKIYPSCGEQYFIIYVKITDAPENFSFEKIENSFMHTALNHSNHTVLPYNGGFFLIYTDERISDKFADDCIDSIIQTLVNPQINVKVGVSDYHLSLDEFPTALQESLYASEVPCSTQYPFVKYRSLGIQRLIFPFSDSPEYQRYMDSILKKILDYDIENNSQLFHTIETYIHCECNLSAAAADLHQHRNTLHYRLTKIQEITGLDCKKFSDLEQISIALKIYRHKCFASTFPNSDSNKSIQ